MGQVFYLTLGADGRFQIRSMDQYGNQSYYGAATTVDEALRAAQQYSGVPLILTLQAVES